MGRGDKRNGFPNVLAKKVLTNSVQPTVPKCEKDGAGHHAAQGIGSFPLCSHTINSAEVVLKDSHTINSAEVLLKDVQ